MAQDTKVESRKIMGLEVAVSRKDEKTVKVEAKMGMLFNKSFDVPLADAEWLRDALGRVLT
jgi:hypothetical protein